MDRAVVDRIARLVEDLPALPVVAQQALSALSDPATRPETLEAVLSRDPALSVKVLGQANSAYYRRGRPVTTLAGAIVLLGFKTLQTLILSSAVHRVLQSAGGAAEMLWLHCFGAGLACRELSRKAGSLAVAPDEAFLVGLFHDVGKGVIASRFPRVYDGVGGCAGEREALGFDHGQLGGVLLARWAIPEALAEAVGGHHDPATRGLAELARVGDWVAWGPAPGLASAPPEPAEACFTALGLNPGDLDSVRERLAGALAEEGRVAP